MISTGTKKAGIRSRVKNALQMSVSARSSRIIEKSAGGRTQRKGPLCTNS